MTGADVSHFGPTVYLGFRQLQQTNRKTLVINDLKVKRILVSLAVLAVETQHVQDALRSAEPRGLPVDLQTLLQGAHLTAPETTQDAGLQSVGLQ